MIFKLAKKYILMRKNKIDKLSSRKSKIKITLMRAFGIIAVVCSHTSGGAVVFPMSNWISPYLYFMPLFVFVSGFLYKCESDNENIFYFILQKIKSLVIPYFVWNILYGLLNTFFKSKSIINYGDDISLNSLFLRPWIDGHQFHFNIPAWFMLSLFIDVVVIFLIRKIFIRLLNFKDLTILLLTVLIAVVSIYFAKQGYNYGIYLGLIRAGFMLPYFQIGYICRKYETVITKYRSFCIVGSAALIGVIVLFLQPVSAQAVFARFSGNSFIITLLISASLLLLYSVCELLEPAFIKNKVVKSIGDNTFSIMMHHGFVIFSINFCIFLLSKFTEISSFDSARFSDTLWYCCPWMSTNIYIVYVILGIIIPIFVKVLYDKFIIKCYDHILLKEQNYKMKTGNGFVS